MKREFLEGLKLADDVKLDKATIDLIMAEYGKDITALKSEQAASLQAVEKERDSYKEQLDNAQTTLKSFEGVNVDELKTKITDLTSEIDANKSKYEAEIADIKFNNLLNSKVTAFGARNSKAVISLLDVDALKASKNQETDITSALNAIKESDGYMFTSNDAGSGDNNEGSKADDKQKNPQFSTGNLDTGNQQQQTNSGFDFGFLGVRPHDK